VKEKQQPALEATAVVISTQNFVAQPSSSSSEGEKKESH
jgi:hypothetical protein